MQAGQKLQVRVRGARLDGSVHSHGAVAAFFAPGKDPEHVPADRAPDRQVALSFDPDARHYSAEVRTDGWAAGDWTMQGIVLGADGAPEGWDWYRFPLDVLSLARRLASGFVDGCGAIGLECPQMPRRHGS